MKKRGILLFVIILLTVLIYAHQKMNQNDPTVINPLLNTLEVYIEKRDKKNLQVSKVDIAWQLDHILKTINRISEALEASNPDDMKFSLNAGRTFSLTAGYIPRGRAKSPEIVLPPEIIKTEDIYFQLEEARENIIKLIQLDDNSNFEHPYFGQLNKAQAIRFVQVHTEHHLKIIEDILEE